MCDVKRAISRRGCEEPSDSLRSRPQDSGRTEMTVPVHREHNRSVRHTASTGPAKRRPLQGQARRLRAQSRQADRRGEADIDPTQGPGRRLALRV
ncbi:hypothetical protein GCM10010271_55720 [Streptomyces kurssanovii]|nr:hypothetical protein GCM10010271_55720 [Streptomyces kurssanovii]